MNGLPLLPQWPGRAQLKKVIDYGEEATQRYGKSKPQSMYLGSLLSTMLYISYLVPPSHEPM
jgi:hypothetical protein